MDTVPLVCISGQVPTHLIGTDAFQECDTTGITRPCTKHNYLVKDDQMIVLTCIANNLNKFGIIEEKDKRLDPWFVFQRFLL